MPPLSFKEVEAIRRTPNRSVLLFLTDRCPVGCAHCCVDSRPNSATITDFSLFDSILSEICRRRELTLVGISGGEPFVERRGLTQAVSSLASAGKDIVLYTSGVWANESPPQWISEVLSKVSTVFLSTDQFHQRQLEDQRFIMAARCIASCGPWIVVQVLDRPDDVGEAERLLACALGLEWRAFAEINQIPPVPYGRGDRVFLSRVKPTRMGKSFGTCSALAAPVVRYDGVVTACCNEQVMLGRGPARLRRKAESGEQVGTLLDTFSEDPVGQVLNRGGGGTLTLHHRFAELAEERFANICDLCWRAQERVAELDPADERMLSVMALIAGQQKQ